MNCYAVVTSTITREIGKSCFDGKKFDLRAKLLFCFSDLLLFSVLFAAAVLVP